jgi:23S rRNA (uracil1939-C5)-methyltransferase
VNDRANHGDEVSVICRGLAHGGSMICDVVAGDVTHIGKKAFVPGLIPTEVATVRVTEDKGAFLHGEVVSITESAAHRLTPPCPVFQDCGGCDLQYMPIQLQREEKRLMVERTLQRQGKLTLKDSVRLLAPHLPEFHYRRRISLHVSPTGTLGFYRQGTGEVIEISHCMIASHEINSLIERISGLVSRFVVAIGGVTIDEFDGEPVPIFILRESVAQEKSEAAIQLLKSEFSLAKVIKKGAVVAEWHTGLTELAVSRFRTLSHFSQVNETGNQHLIDAVLDACHGSDEITEFYAGSGNFSFPLVRKSHHVHAIELDAKLVQYGKARAVNEGLTNLSFSCESAERFVQRKNSPFGPCVLLDPPRSGARVVAEHLPKDRVSKIVYVSCSLPTLTRDLKILTSRGYSLKDVAVIDMFSQTHHVETISCLVAEDEL